jgi:DNA polymerase-1
MVVAIKEQEFTGYQPAKVVTIDGLKFLTKKIQEKSIPIGFDLETTGLNPRHDKIVTVNFGTKSSPYVLDARPYYAMDEEGQTHWKLTIQEFINATPLVIGLNLKFDWEFMFCQWGIKINKLADVMVQELLIHSVGWSEAKKAGVAVNMDDMATRYGFSVQKDMQKWSVDLHKKPEWDMPLPEEELEYVAQDVIVPILIYEKQYGILERKGLLPTASLENAVLPAFAWMECCGCFIYKQRWNDLLNEYREIVKTIKPELERELGKAHFAIMQKKVAAYNAWLMEKENQKKEIEKSYMELFTKGKITSQTKKAYCATAIAEWELSHKAPKKITQKTFLEPFNLGSSAQLSAALKHLGFDITSTDKGALEVYKDNPLIEKLLQWKKLNKLLTTSGDNILMLIDAKDGRIHPEFAQVGAATGRTSSFSPNWQNLPKNDKKHPEKSVKRCIIGETINGKQNVLLTCDLPNIELRIAADMSGDPVMLDAFDRGDDLHNITARALFNLSPDVDPDKLVFNQGRGMRDVAKSINFGIFYGMGAPGLARGIDSTVEEAETFIRLFREKYKKAAEFLDMQANNAVENGYSETILKRKRFYKPLPPRPEYGTLAWDDYSRARGSIRREGKNSPIQGTSADIIKVALFYLYKYLPENCLLINCVHDEVVVECPEHMAQEVKKVVQTCMMAGCRKFLKRVAIPEMEVSINYFWQK